MKIEYILKEEDFIEYHLFSIDENKNTMKTLNICKVFIVGIFLYYAFDLYNHDQTIFAVLLVISAILTLVFYTKIYRTKLRKHYTKIVKKSYADRLGEKETMEFTSEHIITNEKDGERKTRISEVEKINETQNNFFIKLSNGTSFIISKNGIGNMELIRTKWEELKIPMFENLSWEWK